MWVIGFTVDRRIGDEWMVVIKRWGTMFLKRRRGGGNVWGPDELMAVD